MVSGIINHVALVFNICSEIKYHINQGIASSIDHSTINYYYVSLRECNPHAIQFQMLAG